jgi:hypothetical protein
VAIQAFRTGVASIGISYDSTTAVPNASAITAISASAVETTDSYYNSIKNPLPTATNLQFAVALMGRDTTRGGYSVTPISPVSGVLQLTGSQVAKVLVPVGNWPANFDLACAVVVFVKIGAASTWQIAGLRQIVSDVQFETLITRRPVSVETFTLAQLQSFDQTSRALGDRSPLGYTFGELTPTTNDVNIIYDTEEITFSPNNTIDWSASTARSIGVQFETLTNTVKDIVTATAGDYWTFTDAAGATVTEAEQAIYIAQAVIKGNRPLKLTMPPDPGTGVAEIIMLWGLLLQNQEQVNFALSKKNQSPVSFNFQPAGIDAILNSNATVHVRSYDA